MRVYALFGNGSDECHICSCVNQASVSVRINGIGNLKSFVCLNNVIVCEREESKGYDIVIDENDGSYGFRGWRRFE